MSNKSSKKESGNSKPIEKPVHRSDKSPSSKSGKPEKRHVYHHSKKKSDKTEGAHSDKATPAKIKRPEKYNSSHGEKISQTTDITQSDKAISVAPEKPVRHNPFHLRRFGTDKGDKGPSRPGLDIPRRLWQKETNWSHRSEKKSQSTGKSQSDKSSSPKPGKPEKRHAYPHGEKKSQETEVTRPEKVTLSKPGATEKHTLDHHDEKKGQETGRPQSDKTTPSKPRAPGKRNPFQRHENDSLSPQKDSLHNDKASRGNDNLSSKERLERNRYFMLDKAVGRGFDQDQAARGESDRFLANLPANIRASLDNPKTVMTLYTMASRPGSESYNQSLTERFGENLKREFMDKGVRAQIKIVATGETVARQSQADQATTNEKPPSDSDPSDHVDDARFRIAIIDITPATDIAKEASQVALDAPVDQSQPLTEAAKAAQEEVGDTLHKGLEVSSLVLHTVAELTEIETLGLVAPLVEWVGIAQGYSDAREAHRREGVITGIKLGLSAAKNMTAEQLEKHIYAQDLGVVIRNQYWLKYVWEGELANNPVADYRELGMIEGVDRAAEVINQANRNVESDLRRALDNSGMPANQTDRVYQESIQRLRLQKIELIDKTFRDQISNHEEP